MTPIRDIDFLGDESLQRRLVRLSLAILGATAALGVALYLAGVFDFPAEARRFAGVGGWVMWLAVTAIIYFAVLPVHELVHAALFRLFGGAGTRVRFGFQPGMLFAGSPGLVLARGRFCVVLAGPAVVLSVALLAAPAALGLPLLGYVVFALHLSGCVGDLLAIAYALSEPRCARVEDTEFGVRLLGA